MTYSELRQRMIFLSALSDDTKNYLELIAEMTKIGQLDFKNSSHGFHPKLVSDMIDEFLAKGALQNSGKKEYKITKRGVETRSTIEKDLKCHFSN